MKNDKNNDDNNIITESAEKLSAEEMPVEEISKTEDKVNVESDNNEESGEERELTDEEKRALTMTEMLKYLRSIVITFILTSLFVLFVAQPARVNGYSMFPTFNDKQLTIIEKITNKAKYNRNDVIVFKGNNEYLIKRVIGLPGDKVKIENGMIYINGEEFTEDVYPNLIGYAGRAENEITLTEKEYFVMGDNRENSLDSRYEQIGNVNTSDIIGRVIFVFGKTGTFE